MTINEEALVAYRALAALIDACDGKIPKGDVMKARAALPPAFFAQAIKGQNAREPRTVDDVA
jgi:hypothetical protein